MDKKQEYKEPVKDDFGDFEEIKTEAEKGDIKKEEGSEEEILQEGGGRVRMPRGREKIGVITQRYGGNRMEVKATDGKIRNCRVPGRFKRSLWLRPKDIILIIPWEDDDAKGDIIFKYNPGAVNQLRKRGLIDSLQEGF